MREELYNSAGFYNSAFLKMHVHCTEDLKDLTKISVQSEATYFHEYVHYLQDISTTYGLMNICSVVDFVKLANDVAIKNGSAEFEVPFIPLDSPEHDVKANWELKSIYLGGGAAINSVAKIHAICKCVHPVTTSSGQLNAEKVIFDFEEVNGARHKYVFGAYCVSESMAYEMEKQLYPGVLPLPSAMPYNSVRELCDYLLPGFTDDPLNIIALCDACLMLFHPGAFLFDTVQEMNRVGFKPTSPVQVYQFVYSNIRFNYNGHTTIRQLLIGTAADAIGQLGDYFTSPIFQDNKKWINYVITAAVDLRITYPYFMLDIVNGGPIISNGAPQNQNFTIILGKLGSPAVVNDDSVMTFMQPTAFHLSVRPEYLWAFKQIYQIHKEQLQHGCYRCEMIAFCDKSAQDSSINEYTDERCRQEPWKRANNAEAQLCLFAQVWKTWGLMDKVPISKN